MDSGGSTHGLLPSLKPPVPTLSKKSSNRRSWVGMDVPTEQSGELEKMVNIDRAVGVGGPRVYNYVSSLRAICLIFRASQEHCGVPTLLVDTRKTSFERR